MEDLDSSSILNVLKENLEELQSFGVERIGLF